ncbi:MAG: sigma-54-dependent Fis family transcriptional regulator [Candidatus Eisenbacteria bacterium]|uniref:Sigma-54-dependent Fis family transcriptional regulator n=1 Tax=Eiseniibacteriota bacterium TaxID=2212470 RepID=A0A956LYX0_UNCEI|nr:sigma-54-dependent Fis family transcriptional regulator [Candidatus Eisenbacteria bacterium]
MSEEKTPVELEYTLLVVDDEESIRVTLAEALKDDRTKVLTSATGFGALELIDQETVDLVLLDQNLKESGESGLDVLRQIKELRPETLVIMMTAYGKIETAVEAIKLGCFQYLTKPVEIPQLRLVLKSALSTIRLRKEVEFLRSRTERDIQGERVFGESGKMQDLLENVKKIAMSGTSTVLIRGETGTGKELIARMLHFWGDPKGAFVDINCAAFPDNLLESELMGHEAGAFTDARKSKRGLVELADRGTLFLDEIAEMAMPLQAKLLRLLENRSFRRIGGTSEIKFHTRFVAATNKDLFQEVEKGTFREDLYYRLSVIPIHVPALRERPEDIGLLAKYFLDKFNRELSGKMTRISPKALELLCNYRWPGNVRELKNLMERLVLLGNGPELLPSDLPANIVSGETRSPGRPAGEDVVFLTDRVLPLADVEKAGIAHALEAVGGNKTRAAELLGIARQTLRTKIKEYSLGPED